MRASANSKGALRAPSEQRTDQSVQDLVSRLEDVPRVIFHCTLSQVRGPKAARIYAEARREKEKEATRGAQAAARPGSVPAQEKDADSGEGAATSVDPFETAQATAAAAAAAASSSSSSSPLRQEVLVLRDGFQGWQGLYRVRSLSVRALLVLTCASPGNDLVLIKPALSLFHLGVDLAQKDPDLVENFDVNVWQEYSP